MYTARADLPVELTSVPHASVGAPCPMLCAGESSLRLAYYMQDVAHEWNGSTVRVLSDSDGDEPCALVVFQMAYAHMFGPPNDEAFAGHPLASRGLRPYAVFEVRHSSWIHAVERMNAVHPHHKPEHFARYRHFIFAFHDTTFECIAESFTVSVHRGTVRSVLLSAEDQGMPAAP